MTYAALLGSVMAQARSLKGHKQKHIADQMGMVQSGLSKLERGHCAINIMQLITYCLLIDVDYLLILQRTENLRQEIEESGIPVPLKRFTV